MDGVSLIHGKGNDWTPVIVQSTVMDRAREFRGQPSLIRACAHLIQELGRAPYPQDPSELPLVGGLRIYNAIAAVGYQPVDGCFFAFNLSSLFWIFSWPDDDPPPSGAGATMFDFILLKAIAARSSQPRTRTFGVPAFALLDGSLWKTRAREIYKFDPMLRVRYCSKQDAILVIIGYARKFLLDNYITRALIMRSILVWTMPVDASECCERFKVEFEMTIDEKLLWKELFYDQCSRPMTIWVESRLTSVRAVSAISARLGDGVFDFIDLRIPFACPATCLDDFLDTHASAYARIGCSPVALSRPAVSHGSWYQLVRSDAGDAIRLPVDWLDTVIPERDRTWAFGDPAGTPFRSPPPADASSLPRRMHWRERLVAVPGSGVGDVFGHFAEAVETEVIAEAATLVSRPDPACLPLSCVSDPAMA